MWIDVCENDGRRVVFDSAQLTSYEYKNGPASGTGDGVSALTLHMQNSHCITFRGESADEVEAKLFTEKFTSISHRRAES
jgi:hypothetical protein